MGCVVVTGMRELQIVLSPILVTVSLRSDRVDVEKQRARGYHEKQNGRSSISVVTSIVGNSSVLTCAVGRTPQLKFEAVDSFLLVTIFFRGSSAPYEYVCSHWSDGIRRCQHFVCRQCVNNREDCVNVLEDL